MGSLRKRCVNATIMLALALTSCYSCTSETSSTSGKQQNSIPSQVEPIFSEEALKARKRRFNLKDIKVVSQSDTTLLSEVLKSKPCNRLVINFNDTTQSLILKHLTIRKGTSLNELVQAYPLVFEAQIKDLAGNSSGGVFLVPIYFGGHKIASLFYIRNAKVGAIEILDTNAF